MKTDVLVVVYYKKLKFLEDNLDSLHFPSPTVWLCLYFEKHFCVKPKCKLPSSSASIESFLLNHLRNTAAALSNLYETPPSYIITRRLCYCTECCRIGLILEHQNMFVRYFFIRNFGFTSKKYDQKLNIS